MHLAPKKPLAQQRHPKRIEIPPEAPTPLARTSAELRPGRSPRAHPFHKPLADKGMGLLRLTLNQIQERAESPLLAPASPSHTTTPLTGTTAALSENRQGPKRSPFP